MRYNHLQMNAFAVVSELGALPEESSFFTSVGHRFQQFVLERQLNVRKLLIKHVLRLPALMKLSLLQAVDTAVQMNLDGDYGIPVPEAILKKMLVQK